MKSPRPSLKVIHTLTVRSSFVVIMLTLCITSFAQHEVYTTFGFNNHSYLKEGTLGVIGGGPNSYLSSVLSTPVVGVGYKNERWHSGIEASGYLGIVPNLDSNVDLIYTKYAFYLEYLFYLDHFRLGFGYSLQDQRSSLMFGAVSKRSSNYSNGISLNIGYEFSDVLIDLRKELVYQFYEGGRGDMMPIAEYWALRVSKNFQINRNKEPKPLSGRKSSAFNLLLGGVGSMNALREDFVSQRFLKFSAVLGLEYYHKKYNSSIFIKRNVWYALESYLYNFKVNSQSNYIGYAYWLSLRNDQTLKLGLTHNWGLNRAMQYLDYAEGQNNFSISNVYENFSIGSDVRYSLNNKWDLSMNLDYYYKANPRLGKGFNKESLTVGLLYNL